MNAEQTPQYSDIRLAGHEGGDFLFVPISLSGSLDAEDEAPQPTFDAREIELAYWESVKESQDTASIESYLEQYPDGALAALARRRLTILEEGPAPPPAMTKFDGEWRGRARLSSGLGPCPTTMRWQVTITGGKATGSGGGGQKVVFSGAIDADGVLTGTLETWAMIEVRGTYDDGEIEGDWKLRGGCRWDFDLARAED